VLQSRPTHEHRARAMDPLIHTVPAFMDPLASQPKGPLMCTVLPQQDQKLLAQSRALVLQLVDDGSAGTVLASGKAVI